MRKPYKVIISKEHALLIKFIAVCSLNSCFESAKRDFVIVSPPHFLCISICLQLPDVLSF